MNALARPIGIGLTALALLALSLAVTANTAWAQAGDEDEEDGEPTPEQISEDPDPELISEDGLIGVTWTLREIRLADGSTETPANPGDYSLLLGPDGVGAGSADCNRFSGAYTLDGGAITFGNLAVTSAQCPPGSLFDEYIGGISSAMTFDLSGGELAIGYEGGVLVFVTQVLGLPAGGSGGLADASQSRAPFWIATITALVVVAAGLGIRRMTRPG